MKPAEEAAEARRRVVRIAALPIAHQKQSHLAVSPGVSPPIFWAKIRRNYHASLPRSWRPPAGAQDRAFIYLSSQGVDVLALLPAFGPADATHQIVDAAGSPLITHLTERDAVISGALMRWNVWELAESMALLLSLRPGMAVVDTGANVGYFSVLLAKLLGRAGRVFAFEPAPDNHFILEANALLTQQLSPDAAPLAAFRLALADRSGTMTLRLFEGNLGLHSLVQGTEEADQSVPVDAVTLDSLRFPENGRAPVIDRRIDLIKADTQGSELLLLRGAERHAGARPPTTLPWSASRI